MEHLKCQGESNPSFIRRLFPLKHEATNRQDHPTWTVFGIKKQVAYKRICFQLI